MPNNINKDLNQEIYDDIVKTRMLQRAESKAAERSLSVVFELADLICFHAEVRKNAEKMSRTWDM